MFTVGETVGMVGADGYISVSVRVYGCCFVCVCVSYFHTISKLFIFIRFIVPSPMSTLTGLDTLLYFPKLYHTLYTGIQCTCMQCSTSEISKSESYQYFNRTNQRATCDA